MKRYEQHYDSDLDSMADEEMYESEGADPDLDQLDDAFFEDDEPVFGEDTFPEDIEKIDLEDEIDDDPLEFFDAESSDTIGLYLKEMARVPLLNTLEDLFQTMNSFLEGRSSGPDSDSPEQVARLRSSLAKLEADPRGITTDELVQKMKQWRIR